jgi:hypothetical protein
MVAIGDGKRVILPCLAGRKRHIPAATVAPSCLFDARVEVDMRTQAEMVDIVVEIFQQLRMVRIIGPVGRHRIILKRQPPFRRVDVQALVTGRHAVGVVVIPGAAEYRLTPRKYRTERHNPSVVWQS